MTPKQRGLGRGLDALFDDEETTMAVSSTSENTNEIGGNSRKMVGLGQLVASPDQPRQYFDEKAINDLAASIREHGLLQPILVRPVPNSPDKFEIVAGERRWRACQKAQLHEVPIIVRDLDDSQTLQIGLIENLQRQDLSPIEEAKGYQRLMDEFAFSHEDVGEAVSKSRSHVANMIRLLSLPTSVQSMVSKGEISAGHARALINAQNPALLAQEVISKGLSVRQTEKMAAENAGRSIQSRSGAAGAVKGGTSAKDANLLSLEKEVSNALGLTVTIAMEGEHNGALSISFKTLDQLDDVLQRLSHAPSKDI